MPDIRVVLDYVSHAITFAVAGGALLSFVLREKVKQVLSRSVLRDLEQVKHGFARELAELSAAHQQQLEAYKVSLIADAERVRAAQEVKKSLALRIGERRFTSIAGLLDALTGLDVAVAAMASHRFNMSTQADRDAFNRAHDDIRGRYATLDAATRAAFPFLELDQGMLVIEARQQITLIMQQAADTDQPRIASGDARLDRLYQATGAIESNLRDMLHAMEQLA